MSQGITIEEVLTKKQLKDFMQVPFLVHKNDPQWVPPISLDIEMKLNRKKNPFFEHGEASYFVAYLDGEPVGRITAHVDFLYQKQYNAKAGFFGFFDAINNQEVVDALFKKCEEWHQARGNTQLMGPFNFNINGEIGVLIDGYDKAPFLMMTHNMPYYNSVIETAKFSKAKDLLAWYCNTAGELHPKTKMMDEMGRNIPGLTIRSVNKSKLNEEVKIIMHIFNEAWSDNWGFLPLTQSELNQMAQELKLVLDEKLAFIVEYQGEPMAMCVALPNVNEALLQSRGSSLPVTLLKTIWKLKTKQIKGIRLLLMGILPKFRMDERFKAVSVMVYAEIQRRALSGGYTHAELSWTLEDNVAVNSGVEKMGWMKKYKTYRIYQKSIEKSLS